MRIGKRARNGHPSHFTISPFAAGAPSGKPRVGFGIAGHGRQAFRPLPNALVPSSVR